MAGRCWPGYEPVPGKKANEQGSCRKKAKSKTGARGKRMQQRRKKQLDRWKKAHPKSRRSAAQGLRKPGAKRQTRSTGTTHSTGKSRRRSA